MVIKNISPFPGEMKKPPGKLSIAFSNTTYLDVTHFSFYKQLDFLPPEVQIFENHGNLVSNSRASNKNFLATSTDFASFPYI